MPSTRRGDTSNSTARGPSSSAIDVTWRPVSISPPSDRSSDAIASAIACEPPRATGQPTAWPSMFSTSAKAAVPGCPSGCMAWAALPANSARAASVWKRERASRVAGRSASSPNRVVARGWRGIRGTGAIMVSATMPSQSRTVGSISAR